MHTQLINLYPFGANLRLATQNAFDGWEIGPALYTLRRPFRFANHLETAISIHKLSEDGLYVIVHSTPHGLEIEHCPRRFPKLLQAVACADASANAIVPLDDGRLWTIVVDGLTMEQEVVWDPHVQQSIDDLMSLYFPNEHFHGLFGTQNSGPQIL